MKTTIKKIALSVTILFATVFSTSTKAQSNYQAQSMDIRLNGTSNIHDWEIKAVKGNSQASFTVDANNKVTALTRLSFVLPAKSLKSEHTAMDNNTYKALREPQNPNLSFQLSNATVTPTTANNYMLNCNGKLTIAGVTKDVNLLATAKYNVADKTLLITGVKKMKMTDYDVAPPKALLGTIKTGNEISITYTMKYSK